MWERATAGLAKAAFRRGVGVLASLAILAGPTAALANEPVNNNFPGANSGNDLNDDMQVVVTSGLTGVDTSVNPMISSSTDVDYLLLVCSGNRKVSRVGLNFLNADIDLYVYATTINHPLLGQSILGGTSNETANITPTYSAVVAKVVGFNSATSSYILAFACS